MAFTQLMLTCKLNNNEMEESFFGHLVNLLKASGVASH